jgi:sulfonate transport system substrate-binding protein
MQPMTISRLSRRHLLAAAVLVGVAPTVAAAEPLTIRFGFASTGVDNRPFSGGTPAATAHAGRYVETALKDDPDIKVEWYFFKGAGPAVNEAIANGQLDFAWQGDLPSVIGRANGLKTKILMANGAHAPMYLAVPVGSPINSVKELRGKKVVIFRGTNNHLAAVKVLAANGLSERDLQVLNMDNATTTAALASKYVDAAFGNYPLISLIETERAKIVYTTKGDNPAFERHSAVLVTAAFEAAHPRIVTKIVKALVEAAHWSSDEANRDALMEIWARSGTPAAVFRYDFDGQPLRYRNSPVIDPFLIEQYRSQARLAKEFGLLRRDVDVKGWFELRYLDQALKDLGLEDYWPRYGTDGKPLGS